MSTPPELTARQTEVLAFIRNRAAEQGFAPTVREIGQYFNISSPNGVVSHLRALEKKGYIEREPNRSRTIRLTADAADRRGFPMVGRIAAGVLHEAVEQSERIDFAEMFDSNDSSLFVLEVSGDSMVDDHIADGDFVIVRRQPTASQGQIVVALTDENEATLKRWYKEKNHIRLVPSNRRMKPIKVKNAKILGVVEGVIRRVG
jgi:repressor LexA